MRSEFWLGRWSRRVRRAVGPFLLLAVAAALVACGETGTAATDDSTALDREQRARMELREAGLAQLRIPEIGTLTGGCRRGRPPQLTLDIFPGGASTQVRVKRAENGRTRTQVDPGRSLSVRVGSGTSRWTFLQATEAQTVRDSLRVRLSRGPRFPCVIAAARMRIRTGGQQRLGPGFGKHPFHY